MLVTVTGVAQAAEPGDGGAASGPAFHLEGRPAIDDVFGDASDYRRAIDRFLDLSQQLSVMRDDFSRAAQAVLAELSQRAADGAKKKGCPSEVATPYARASHLGNEYLRVGRELTRHFEQIREFDRLGESIGLTPDYRWKVRKVLVAYQTLLTDYREMKLAFHDQLHDELRYAGCDLTSLMQKGGAVVAPASIEEWPQPGTPGSPGTPLPKAVDVKAETPPSSLPPEKMPGPAPIGLPKRPADSRSGILFYVDNSRCARSSVVYLDGKRIGEVAASTRVGFQTTPGPHDLCVLEDQRKQCGTPGTVRRAYLHDSWTISLRCEQ